MREEKSKGKQDCWSVWCCPGRCDWFKKLFVGVITFFAIAAFIIALIAYYSNAFSTTQRVYTVNGVIQTSPANHVLAASIPLAMTLPNNLIEYVGTTFRIDCASPLNHVVSITPGVLTTSWDGTNKVMTCNLGAVGGAGVTFRIITPSLIRIESSKDVVFSP
jgi:hypothetical protein